MPRSSCRAALNEKLGLLERIVSKLFLHITFYWSLVRCHSISTSRLLLACHEREIKRTGVFADLRCFPQLHQPMLVKEDPSSLESTFVCLFFVHRGKWGRLVVRSPGSAEYSTKPSPPVYPLGIYVAQPKCIPMWILTEMRPWWPIW